MIGNVRLQRLQLLFIKCTSKQTLLTSSHKSVLDLIVTQCFSNLANQSFLF